MSNKRSRSEELARKKEWSVFSANEQSSRDAIKCKRVKREEEKKRQQVT